MRFDSVRVEKLLASFREAVAQLKRLRKMKRETFLGDPDKVASAKYHFIMAIEAALDTAHHLIAKNEWRLPKDYADTFRVLGEVGFVAQEFVPTLEKMAKFRNRLVHLYWDVDDEFLFDVLQHGVGDLECLLERFGHMFNAYSD